MLNEINKNIGKCCEAPTHKRANENDDIWLFLLIYIYSDPIEISSLMGTGQVGGGELPKNTAKPKSNTRRPSIRVYVVYKYEYILFFKTTLSRLQA